MTMVTEQAVQVDDPATPPVRPRRVVLKMSGEVFGGGEVGVDPDVVQGIARQIATVIRRGIGMQIAAMRPRFLSRDEVPADTVESERRIAEQTAREEGKPEQALPRIVEGRVNSFFKDFVLLEQPSVTDQKKTVAQVAKEAGIEVTRFVRFEVGQA